MKKYKNVICLNRYYLVIDVFTIRPTYYVFNFLLHFLYI